MGFDEKSVKRKENLLIAIKMSKSLFVCVTCEEDFKREFGAKRHNKFLHFERSQIVGYTEYDVISHSFIQKKLAWKATNKIEHCLILQSSTSALKYIGKALVSYSKRN